MSKGADLPTVRQILELADEFGFEMTVEDGQSYQNVMQGPMASYRVLEDIPEWRPEQKYPRNAGYRPTADENPYNGWYMRCDIKGAKSGILKGYDIGIKDPVGVAGIPTMNGSRMLEGYIPDVDATIVTRILDAGGTIAGKTTTEDCSFSAGGHTSALGPIRNPHKPTHSPGGSSGGSGAVVAAGDVKMAIGGDQAGSIRLPASRCGIVGLKPTFGLVPYTGAVMIEMTIDVLGPMCDTVENTARLLTAIAGPDPMDPRQRGVIPEDYVQDYMPAIGKGVKGLTIGLLKEGFGQKAWPDLGFPASDKLVDRKCKAAVKALEAKGAKVKIVSAPMHKVGPHLWNAIGLEGSAEFMLKGYNQGSNWRGFYNTRLREAVGRGFDSRANDLPVQAKLVLLLGEYMHRNYHGRYYSKAQNQRYLLDADYDRVLEECDVFAMPTVPFQTPAIIPTNSPIEQDMEASLNMIANTSPISLSGHPSVSVPCAMEDGLPIGLMLTGRQFDDLTVLRVADAVEKSGNWKKR